jgi:16S rRNA (guanine966-N2)-methyltransferase
MSIRIIGGFLGGRTLTTLPGRHTRPATERVREAVFSILQHDIEDTRVLDLFAGSGAYAIEAISRGASFAVMIEKDQMAAAIIKQNLHTFNLDLRLIIADWKKGLEILSGEGEKFNLVFSDPPYGTITAEKIDEELKKYDLMAPGSFLIMEHAGDMASELGNLIKTRRFGDSAISIFAYE